MYRYQDSIRNFINCGGRVWDTQLVQYLLEGQSKTFPSLDYTSEIYGGTLKDDRIKAFWDEDIDTEDMPQDMLVEYLVNDVSNTEKIYLQQRKEVEERGMMPLVESQMEALCATTEMEWNGMYFDRGIAAAEITTLAREQEKLEYSVRQRMSHFLDSRLIDINPYSNDQLSVVLFGGSLKYKEDKAVLNENGTPQKYKTGVKKGQIKTRKVDANYTTEGMQYARRHTTKLKKEGFYATNDKVLKNLRRVYVNDDLITMLLRLREVKKDIAQQGSYIWAKNLEKYFTW